MSQPDEEFTPGAHLGPDERDPEAPPVDAFEQSMVADPAADEPVPHRGLEVGDWDALEQARIVDLDDDYDH